MIDYPPEYLYELEVMSYEWIDNLNFTLKPGDCVKHVDEYVSIASKRFLEAGWDGEGEIELMWIPPFMVPKEKQQPDTNGIIVWHVKQNDDGISWLLYPPELFEED